MGEVEVPGGDVALSAQLGASVGLALRLQKVDLVMATIDGVLALHGLWTVPGSPMDRLRRSYEAYLSFCRTAERTASEVAK